MRTIALQRLLGAALLILAAAFAPGARAQDKLPEYRLGPGDSIRISVFQNPNLTLEARVSEDGTITYPLIGSVRIGGMTTARAEQTIAKALDDGNFIKRPQVSILSLNIRSSQVSVLGLVSRPGRFPLETFNVRVSEMIALAGGIAATGDDFAIVTGERAGKPYRKEIDIAAVFLSNKHDDDVTVAPGDVIYVHRAGVLHLRRSTASRLVPRRARHDDAAGAGAGRRADPARHRARLAPAPARREQPARSQPPGARRPGPSQRRAPCRRKPVLGPGP